MERKQKDLEAPNGASAMTVEEDAVLWQARHAMRWAMEDDADERLRGLRASTIGKLTQAIAAIDAALSRGIATDAAEPPKEVP